MGNCFWIIHSNNILNGFTVREEGTVVGTAASIIQLDFRGGNIIATVIHNQVQYCHNYNVGLSDI